MSSFHKLRPQPPQRLAKLANTRLLPTIILFTNVRDSIPFSFIFKTLHGYVILLLSSPSTTLLMYRITFRKTTRMHKHIQYPPCVLLTLVAVLKHLQATVIPSKLDAYPHPLPILTTPVSCRDGSHISQCCSRCLRTGRRSLAKVCLHHVLCFNQRCSSEEVCQEDKSTRPTQPQSHRTQGVPPCPPVPPVGTIDQPPSHAIHRDVALVVKRIDVAYRINQSPRVSARQRVGYAHKLAFSKISIAPVFASRHVTCSHLFANFA